MPVDISGTVLQGAAGTSYFSLFTGISGVNRIRGSSIPALDINTSGYVREQQKVAFIATLHDYGSGIGADADPGWLPTQDGYGSSYGENYTCYQPNYRVHGNNNYTSRCNIQYAGWGRRVVLPFASLNNGNCYNPLDGRFTAPISGLYLFSSNFYLNRFDSGGSTYAWTTFLINGFQRGDTVDNKGLRLGAYKHKNQISGTIAGGYSYDSQIEEIVYLFQNDMVELAFSTANNISIYLNYGSFTGVLLG